MNTLRRSYPTPLEAEYKEQIKQSAKITRPTPAMQPDSSLVLPEDRVSLSSAQPETGNPAAKLRPSQPVTISEKQFLNSQFSTYA